MKEHNKFVRIIIEYGVYIILLVLSVMFIIMGYFGEGKKDNSDSPDYVIEIVQDEDETNDKGKDTSRENIYVVSNNTDNESEIPKNVGFSLLASAIAAFILDTNITRKQNKKDKYDKKRLLSDLKCECEEILSELMLAFSFCNGIDEKKRTYKQWVEELFNEEYMCTKNQSDIKYFIQQINEIRKCARKTLDNCKLFYDNIEIDENLERNLKKIISNCTSIENWSNSIKHHDFLITSFDSLKETIVLVYPELKEKFEQEYNYEDLSEWG